MTPEDRIFMGACRRRGVPDMWLEDAVQDAHLDELMRGYRRHTSSMAVDAARRYGPRRFPPMVPLEFRGFSWAIMEWIELDRPIFAPDELAVIDELDRVERALPTLSPGMRAALELELSGQRPTPDRLETHYVQLANARRRLNAA